METPLIRSAPVPMLLLSQIVKSANVKFVLCGEGADEIFAGYPVFLKGQASFENRWQILKPYLTLFKDKDIINYAKKEYWKIIHDTKSDDKITENRKKEIVTKLSQYLLVNQGDRVSMANGVEQRFPFLDTEIVNFAFSLDKKLLIQNGNGKEVLRNAFKSNLPKEITERKKQGYLAPDDTVVNRILSIDQYKYLLEKEYFDKVNIFDFEKTKLLTERIKGKNQLKEFESNALLFVITTHLLYSLFIENIIP